MPDDPAKRFAGGPEAKLFAIGQKPVKGINTQVTRDAIDDEEFSWLENMQPIGKDLYSMVDATNEIPNVGSNANPIVYFYMYNSNKNSTSFVSFDQYVFIAFQTGTAAVYNASTGGLVAQSTTTSIFYPGTSTFGTPLPQASQYSPGGIVIVSNATVNGYFAADTTGIYFPGQGAPLWLTSGTTGETMPSGTQGATVGVWQGRVWSALGVTYLSSAPGDGTDYTIANGATSQISTDPFIKRQYLSIQQANGFLYLFGDSSVNVISNIQSSGSPTVTTTFNNQNVDPQIGASWQNTVQTFGRGLIYANTTGVYALFGGATQKVSDQLDGIFDDNGNFIASLSLTQGPSSAVAMINNQRCYLLLVPLRGPFDSVKRNALVVWDGKKWFVASQSPDLIFIGTQMINSQPSAWGTDGISLYKLFSSSNGSMLTKIWQTKLFNGSGFQITKSAYRIFTHIFDQIGSGVTEFATVDSQLINAPLVEQAFTQSDVFLVTWINASSQMVQWVNSSNSNISWNADGNEGFIGTGLSINTRGNMIGWTATSRSAKFVLSEEIMVYQEQSPIGG
jgi:hypothetical protein